MSPHPPSRMSKQKIKVVIMVGEGADEIIQGITITVKAGATDTTIGIHPTATEELVTMRA